MKNNILNSQFIDFDLYAAPDSEASFLPALIPENFSGVVFLSNVPCESGNLPKAYLDLLSKICQAVNLELGSSAIHINIITERQIRFIDLVKKMDIKQLIVFGPTPAELGVNLSVKPYQIVKWQKIQLLFADSLEIIHTDLNKKRALWSLLKQLFLT